MRQIQLKEINMQNESHQNLHVNALDGMLADSRAMVRKKKTRRNMIVISGRRFKFA